MDVDLLKTLATIACEAAISGGAEFADVGAWNTRSLAVDIRANTIKSCDARRHAAISVRAIYRGGTGWSSTDKMDEDSAIEAGKKAAALAKLAEPDPDCISLVAPAENYPEVPGLADPAIETMDIRSISKYAIENIGSALGVSSKAIVEG